MPVNKVVRVQVTGVDVIHAFAVPSFGIKIDAIPGRLNETWFKATREGIYYGQCSELCGKDHAFMPIEVRVVSEQAYAAWLADAKKKFALDGRAGNAVAAARREGRIARAMQDSGDGNEQRRVSGSRSWQLTAAAHGTRTLTTRMTIITRRPDGAASSIRPTTRTSARCTWCSPSSAG